MFMERILGSAGRAARTGVESGVACMAGQAFEMRVTQPMFVQRVHGVHEVFKAGAEPAAAAAAENVEDFGFGQPPRVERLKPLVNQRADFLAPLGPVVPDRLA